MALLVCRVCASSSLVTGAVSSAEITASSVKDPSTASEDGGHATRLEEVLFRMSVSPSVKLWRETYVVPGVNEMYGAFSLIPFVHLAEEH